MAPTTREKVPAAPATGEPRVLLVLTPWAAPYFPGISVALLRTILVEQGVPCDLAFLNLLFSKLTGGDPLYEDQIAFGTIAELAFTPYYFDTPPQDAARTLHEYYRAPNLGGAGERLEPYERLLQISGRWVDEAYASVRWEDYDIVGFSLMFQQTLSSLAIARLVKRDHPHITIICGGPSCAEPMGEELVRSFPEIDYVVTGEGDAVIAPLVRHIRETPDAPCDLPGVIARMPDGFRRSRRPAAPFMALDSLPTPDYGPYFERLAELGLSHFHPVLYLENSRGCWWGQKHHCTFCSIEDSVMKYRTRSVERVLEDVLTLSERHQVTSFLTADNILDHRAYRTLLPRLRELREEHEFDFTFFFELKANLTREQVRLLRDAGVAQVQPGIESFSDHILKLMNKGCTGISQLQTLKYFAEFDIEPVWNVIYMNPGERPDDYYEMAAMVRSMHHLPPLQQHNQVQMLLQRFNLYFQDPEAHGVRDIRPQAFYKLVFPDERVDHAKLAYFFDYAHDCHDDPELRAAHKVFLGALDTWRDAHRPNMLLQRRGPGFVEIDDRRHGDGETIVLEGLEHDIFVALDSVRVQERVVSELADRADRAEVEGVIDDLVERALVYRSPVGQCLNLPLLKERVNPRLGSPYAS